MARFKPEVARRAAPLTALRREDYRRVELCNQLGEYVYVVTPTAKTAAQRQADRKARELAAGRVQWKRWAHPDDVPALAEYADKLARKRARSEQKAG
jgi:hypothetical protein